MYLSQIFPFTPNYATKSRGILLCLLASSVLAAPPTASTSPGTPASNAPPPVLVDNGPTWEELSPNQRAVLQPLAEHWKDVHPLRRRKWMLLANESYRLSPAEQSRLQNSIIDWTVLSMQQRVQARLNFAHSKLLAPTDKTAQWQAYQALSPEEKQKFSAAAGPKANGAALVIKPTPPQKILLLPPETIRKSGPPTPPQQ